MSTQKICHSEGEQDEKNYLQHVNPKDLSLRVNEIVRSKPQSYARSPGVMSLLDNNPMKPRKSLLNPYADSFVPLSRQSADKQNKSHDTSENIKESSQVMMSETETSNIASGIAKGHVDASHFNKLSLENSTPKNPDDETERPNDVDELEYDLALLAVTFPGVSDQSLADVYFANGGDLDATIEMMNQLENLPEMSNFNHPACSSATPDTTSSICDEASGSS